MSNLGNKAIMAKNIQYYMDKHNKTRNDMCETLGVKYTTLTDWVKGKSYPRIDKIELMANYFGVSKADLVEDHTDAPLEMTQHNIISDIEYEYIEKYRALDKHGTEIVDIVLQKEYDRCRLNETENHQEYTAPILKAAHQRTDIDLPEDADTSDDDVMKKGF